jgi:hypothetical protein
VDKLTKYSHFISLSHPFTTKIIVQLFIDHVFKLHGLPLAIITEQDRIFTSQLWHDLFKSLGVKLKFSSAYHPQSDGQTKRVNQCLEITSDAWHSKIQRSGTLTFQQLSGGIIHLFTLH